MLLLATLLVIIGTAISCVALLGERVFPGTFLFGLSIIGWGLFIGKKEIDKKRYE